MSRKSFMVSGRQRVVAEIEAYDDTSNCYLTLYQREQELATGSLSCVQSMGGFETDEQWYKMPQSVLMSIQSWADGTGLY